MAELTYSSTSPKPFIAIVAPRQVKDPVKHISPDALETIVARVLLGIGCDLRSVVAQTCDTSLQLLWACNRVRAHGVGRSLSLEYTNEIEVSPSGSAIRTIGGSFRF
jgi:hypothetical protein